MNASRLEQLNESMTCRFYCYGHRIAKVRGVSDSIFGKGQGMKIVGMMLLVIGTVAIANATPVPEINASSGINAVALLSGGLLMLRSRRKK
jgi:hypothetical protein